MASEQEINQRLAAIDEQLASGITTVTTDGTTTTVDLNQLRRERRELRRQLDTMRQPRVATWDLSRGV